MMIQGTNALKLFCKHRDQNQKPVLGELLGAKLATLLASLLVLRVERKSPRKPLGEWKDASIDLVQISTKL